ARRHTRSRSIARSWPTITFLISNKACSSNSAAACGVAPGGTGAAATGRVGSAGSVTNHLPWFSPVFPGRLRDLPGVDHAPLNDRVKQAAINLTCADTVGPVRLLVVEDEEDLADAVAR